MTDSQLRVDAHLRNLLRDLIYPGLDLHTRNRASLSKFWRNGHRDVLDAGSGNGYFSWLAYKDGASVVAINVDNGQVEKARGFLVGHRKADPRKLSFECANLYDLRDETRSFDEIICFEVLEHIRDDKTIVTEFYRLLRPGGILHLCCPNKLHPRHQAEVLDVDERGGHVRAGYTEDEYRELLEPIGFEIQNVVGIGPTILYIVDEILRKVRTVLPEVAAIPFLLLALPIVRFAKLNPAVPYSLYVKSKKPNKQSAAEHRAPAAKVNNF